MRIAEMHSHLNGLEFMLIHKSSLWAEIRNIVEHVSAVPEVNAYPHRELLQRTRVDAAGITMQLEKLFGGNAWSGRTHLNPGGIALRAREFALESKNSNEDSDCLDFGGIQTGFVKERVAVEVQFGNYATVAYDMFVKHVAFYIDDQIDVGIEILPMKKMQSQMSSGVPPYERALYNMIRRGRSVPAVPLIVVGVES